MNDTSIEMNAEILTCQQAAEFFPWLLNGSLETGEKQALKDHLAACESCRVELAESREAWGIFTQHIPSLALVEYARGGEPRDLDVATIESHLKSCASCRQEVEWATADRILPFRSPNPHRRVPERVRTWGAWAVAAGLAAVLATSTLINGFDRAKVTDMTSAELATPTVATSGGHRVDALDVVFDANAVFVDGFESGATTTWANRTQ